VSLVEINARIAKAVAAAGRPAESVELIAVSKRQPRERIEAVLGEGHRVFGENQIQEAARRWEELRDQWAGVKLHLVGGLQTNKVRQAMRLFDTIHSLDRTRLAARIADMTQEIGSQPELFVQVNTGEEPQKGGIMPAAADDFLQSCERDYGLSIRD